MNKDLEILKSLRTSELIPMLKSIRLGQNHLRAHLDAAEFEQMLNIIPPSEHKTKTITATIQEKIGNAVIICNTVITSCFGMMLGALGLYGMKVNFTIIKIAMTVSICSSLILATLSIRNTRLQSRDAINNYKLFQLELFILNLIIKKREDLITKTAQHIYEQLDTMFDRKIVVDDKTDLLVLTDKINELFHNYRIAPKDYQDKDKLYVTTSAGLYRKIHLLLKRNRKLRSLIAGNSLSETLKEHRSYLHMFTRINTRPQEITMQPSGWFRQSYMSIFLGLMPTLFGGFASMFVFLVGFPDIFRALNWVTDVSPHYIYFIKNGGLITAMTLTIYFGYSHIYSNYKNFLRLSHRNKCDNQIDLKNDKVMRLSRKISLLDRIDSLLETVAMLKQVSDLVHPTELHTLRHEHEEGSNTLS